MATSVAASTLRRALLAGAAVAAVGTGALATADAQAAFTLGRCQGASGVKGMGASFQKDLHLSFSTFFNGSQGCDGTPTAPAYTSNGSGDGRAAMGAGGGPLNLAKGDRDPSQTFAGVDEAPTPAQQADINNGSAATTADDAKVRIIPIATGASAFIVNLPQGCSIEDAANKTNGADGALGGLDTGDSAADKTQRVRLSSAVLEAAFAGDAGRTTWGGIAPGIRGTATSPQQPAGTDCEDVEVKRVVRQDNSGTTYGWKAYLNLIRPERGWTGAIYGASPNTTWPGLNGGAPARPQAAVGAACDNADQLCSAAGRGGGALADAVTATDGSIGYVDLSTARTKGFEVTRSATTQDTTYWSPLETLPNGTPSGLYAEPTFEVRAHGASSIKGAACARADVVDAPTAARAPNGDVTLGDWSRAFAAGGSGYPACVLTYALAWDDAAPVYGATADQEAKARTVKDYLGLIVSPAGQSFLLGADYSPLPLALQAVAQDGVDKLDWNKTAGGGTPPEERRPTPPDTRAPGPGVNPPPAPAAPSNQFSVPSRKATASLLTFTLQLPGAGALKAEATAKSGKKTIKVAAVSASPRGAGRVTVRLKLSAAAKKALARAKGKKLKVTVKFTFTPTGGTARTVTQTVTVRAAARRPARKPGKKKAAKR